MESSDNCRRREAERHLTALVRVCHSQPSFLFPRFTAELKSERFPPQSNSEAPHLVSYQPPRVGTARPVQLKRKEKSEECTLGGFQHLWQEQTSTLQRCRWIEGLGGLTASGETQLCRQGRDRGREGGSRRRGRGSDREAGEHGRQIEGKLARAHTAFLSLWSRRCEDGRRRRLCPGLLCASLRR